MTKKDYIKIANVFINAYAKNTIEKLEKTDALNLDKVDMLKEDNHRFDEYKFMKACGFRHGYKNEGSYIRK